MHARLLRRPFAVLFVLGLLFGTSLLGGCSSKGGGGAPVAQADTTVLVYIIGSDLETRSQFATKNIVEMMTVGSTSGMNVILQTGGATPKGIPPADTKSMQPGGIDWTRVQRYIVHKDSLQQLEDLGQDEPGSANDMGSPATLEKFLSWGVGSYPATKYIVVLWDHGGGVNEGVGPDEITEAALPVSGTSQAIAAASKDLGQKFTIVGFDTCLMGTAEVATSLMTSAEYFLASQDLEPGPGWDYQKFLRFVAANPNATGAAIGREVIDTYVAKSTANDATYPVTLSVVDLSRSQALIAATNDFATALVPYAQTTDGWNQIALARKQTLDWETSPIFGMTADLVDMSRFVTEVVSRINEFIGPDPVLTQKGTALTTAIGSAVAYSRGTGSDAQATGLTVYFPSVLWAFVSSNNPDTPRTRTYATNTSVDGAPFFAASYTDGATGLVRKFFDFYDENKVDLQAIVTLGNYPTDYLAGKVVNEFDYALAAHGPADACKLYKGALAVSPPILLPCYEGMQVVTSTVDPVAGGRKLDPPPRAEWPHIEGFPVIMVPDQIAQNRAGEYDLYLVPVFLYDEHAASYLFGFLRVEDTAAVPPDSRYRVIGFQYYAPRDTGKVTPLENGQVFALAAFHPWSGFFLRTDHTVLVFGSGVQIVDRVIAGGGFNYVVSDLTGATQIPENGVDYPPVISTFAANPVSITRGSSSMLSWQVAGATTVFIEPGVGYQTGNYVYVTPEATTTYTLTAMNGNSAVTRTVRVTVTPALQ